MDHEKNTKLSINVELIQKRNPPPLHPKPITIQELNIYIYNLIIVLIIVDKNEQNDNIETHK